MFHGQISKPKAEIHATEFTAALQRVPDATVFPVLPHDADITVAPDGSHEHYIKRPNMAVYELYNEDDFLARVLLAEALIMERLARHPHPNIVRYHGVRVRRGRVTGLILDKHQSTLLDYVKSGLDLDEEIFLTTLDAAVAHLHSLGLAHNDINPENIMITFEKLPILIDFGSCQEFGKRVLTQGTPGWVDAVDGRSGKEHDIYALARMRDWFKDPWF